MANAVNSVWTMERVAKLVELQSRGWSCAQIASDLAYGITRNAVIGKLHRLGITGGAAAISNEDRLRRAKAAARRKLDKRIEKRRQIRENLPTQPMIPHKAYVPLVCTEVTPRGISLLDLNPGDCRYPEGEGTGITFCGHPALAGRSYCAAHANLSLDRSKPRTRAEYALYKRQNRAEQTQAILEAAE